MNNVERHKAICEELNALYERKNHDYGDSFHLSFLEEGMAMARIRLGDKLNRFKTLTKKPDAQQVQGESIRDTLLDLANYAIMTAMELDGDQGCEELKTVKSHESWTLRYYGHCVTLEREFDEYKLDSPVCSICSVCIYANRSGDEEPCDSCIHGAGRLYGNHERFVLDNVYMGGEKE